MESPLDRNIEKTNTDRPPLSSFINFQQPPTPLILQQKNRRASIRKSRPSLQTGVSGLQSNFVDVPHIRGKENLMEKIYNKNPGIKGAIDQCVQAIMQVYQVKNARKSVEKSKKINLEQIKQPVSKSLKASQVFEQQIHRIDPQLVFDYIQTIYKQYGFKDRITPNLQPIERSQQVRKDIPFHRENFLEKNLLKRSEKPIVQFPVNSRSRFLSVTLKQKQPTERNTPVPRQAIPITIPPNFRPSLQNIPQPSIIPKLSEIQSPYLRMQQIIKEPSNQFNKIADTFRYCINCSEPVLSPNIDYHQKFQCDNFNRLYSLSIHELQEFILKKISFLKQSMHSLLQKMSEPINGKTNSELELTSMISNLHNLIKRTDLVISGHHNDTDSKRINYLSKNSYISAVEMASKLAWFLEIYCALSNHAKKQAKLQSQKISPNTIERTAEVEQANKGRERMSTTLTKPGKRSYRSSIVQGVEEDLISPFEADEK